MTNAELEIAEKIKPTIVVIFGGCGDLTQRKLMPALYAVKEVKAWTPAWGLLLPPAYP